MLQSCTMFLMDVNLTINATSRVLMQICLLNDNIITSHRQTSKRLEGLVQLNTRELRCLSEVYPLNLASPGWKMLRIHLTHETFVSKLLLCDSIPAPLGFSLGLCSMQNST